jgi:putative heme iron utilization protein
MLVPEFEVVISNLPHLPSGMNDHGWFTEFQLKMLRKQIKAYIIKQATAFFNQENPQQGASLRQNVSGNKIIMMHVLLI